MWGTPHFSTGQILLKKNCEKMNIDTIEKTFLIDPRNTNNAIYRDSLILSFSLGQFVAGLTVR